MKKVCVITATRSEYGLLRWIIDEIYHDEELMLQIIVTGGHLSPEQGFTYQYIENDGYNIDAKVEMLLASGTVVGITKSMGVCAIGISDALHRLDPDIIVVLGDRYELLPIVGTALVMRIPIAHISGGDITEGAIDNEIRNAVTMMSTLHFAGTEFSAARIERMIGTRDNIYVTGETNLDNFARLSRFSRTDLAETLGLDINKKWIMMTYHPVTKESKIKNMRNVAILLNFLNDIGEDFEFIISKANTDLYGNDINQLLSDYVVNRKSFHLFTSLGQQCYVSILPQLYCMIGNSSSGIYETGYWHLPTINIGHRQDGRFMTSNILCCENDKLSIQSAFLQISTEAFQNRLKQISNPYGDGKSSARIVQYIKKYLYAI